MLGSARMRTPLLGTAKVLAVLCNTDRGVLVARCRMMPLDSENVLWVGDAGLAAWQSSVLCRAAALSSRRTCGLNGVDRPLAKGLLDIAETKAHWWADV